MLHRRSNLSYAKGVTTIAIITIEKCPTIYRENISFFENSLLVWYSSTTTLFTEVQILPRNDLTKEFGKPLKVGTAPWSLINSSAIVSNWRVETPGLICLPNSARVAPTSWFALRIRLISSSVFRNIPIAIFLINRQIQFLDECVQSSTVHHNGASEDGSLSAEAYR